MLGICDIFDANSYICNFRVIIHIARLGVICIVYSDRLLDILMYYTKTYGKIKGFKSVLMFGMGFYLFASKTYAIIETKTKKTEEINKYVAQVGEQHGNMKVSGSSPDVSSLLNFFKEDLK